MKVLLLGATGSLGSRLLLALLAHQHAVVVYVRNDARSRQIFPEIVLSKVVIVSGDAADANVVRDTLIQHKCDALVNSAARIALFPWQAPLGQAINHAVGAAAVEASEKIGRPIRAWFVAGLTVMDIPGTNGVKVKS